MSCHKNGHLSTFNYSNSKLPVGKVLNSTLVGQVEHDARPNRNVKRYKSLNKSGLVKVSAAASGSLCCMLFKLSAFKARQPCRNSGLVNLHICSALHFQAKTRTQNSSGLNSKSFNNASVPGTNIASSQSLNLSNKEFIFGSELCFSEDPDRPKGGMRETKLRRSVLPVNEIAINSIKNHCNRLVPEVKT